ncbi:MAG: MoaD/ThiS family protein [Candidatus Micrarchaeota archaeon]|nr:MoaD/ThiS family protein [Candidatus Micrarchaeota archaeon]
MKITLVTDRETRPLDLPDGATVSDVIVGQKLNAQTFFTKRNGQLCHPQTILKDGDELRLVGIIYGG